MADIPEDHMHVATGAANRVVQTFGIGNFLPTNFLQVLITAILQALLTHQQGQQAAALAQTEDKPKKGKTVEKGDD